MLVFDMFSLRFCIVYCNENRHKINLTPYGENFIILLTEIKFKIWSAILSFEDFTLNAGKISENNCKML